MATNINPSDQTITQYDVQVGGANNLLVSVGPGSSGQVLQSAGNAANPAYSTATYPASTTINQLLYSSAANTVAGLATANTAILATNSSGVPSITTASGNWNNTSRSCFLAYVNGNVSSVTGDGTNYVVAFNATLFDQNSDFNTSTNVFTAPVVGKYLFTYSVVCYNLGTGHTAGQITIVGGGNHYANFGIVNTAAGRDLQTGNDEYGFTGSIIIALTASQTVQVNLTVTGSTKTVNIQGGGGPYYTTFSGTLLC